MPPHGDTSGELFALEPNMDVMATTTEPSNQQSAAPVSVATVQSRVTKNPPRRIVWRNVVLFSLLHLYAVYGLYCVVYCYPLTWAWTALLYYLAALGITAGAHRLWSHRSYKAKTPTRIFLMLCNCISGQNDIIEWAIDHRTHHKYSETSADPHNATRGLFFAHVGWLLVRKHPDVIAKGKQLNYADLYADPVCRWQRKYYRPLAIFFIFVMPTIVPVYFWGESWVNAIFVCAFLRYILVLNATWCVNSWAHWVGNKPYDKNINPSENLFVAFSAIGEGFHNYHHAFPQDYATSEFGWKWLNLTSLFIDSMEFWGQIYDKKRMSKEAVNRRIRRTGDGTHPVSSGSEADDDQMEYTTIRKQN